MTLILDTGALIAIERGDRNAVARVRRAYDRGDLVRTSAIVVAQVWRDSSGRQARLARLLIDVDVRPVDQPLARRAGVLLGRAGTSDAVDAALVLLAADGDVILTSDPEDIAHLVGASGIQARVLRSRLYRTFTCAHLHADTIECDKHEVPGSRGRA